MEENQLRIENCRVASHKFAIYEGHEFNSLLGSRCLAILDRALIAAWTAQLGIAKDLLLSANRNIGSGFT